MITAVSLKTQNINVLHSFYTQKVHEIQWLEKKCLKRIKTFGLCIGFLYGKSANSAKGSLPPRYKAYSTGMQYTIPVS
jgi:hypothetical protein